MMSYTVPKVTKKQLETLHEALAMHYYCTGTSFQRVQEHHLLKAFQAVNPSVTLPNRKKLADFGEKNQDGKTNFENRTRAVCARLDESSENA